MCENLAENFNYCETNVHASTMNYGSNAKLVEGDSREREFMMENLENFVLYFT